METKTDKPSKRLRWAMIRIYDVGETLIGVIIPSWDSEAVVGVSRKVVPEWVSQLRRGSKLWARVNIGAERPWDLRFESWQLDTPAVD
jgi:hypothetical protein